jgi:hypothetical protein
MAGPQYLNRLRAVCLDYALTSLQERLPADAPEEIRQALEAASRDVVASRDADFKVAALIGAQCAIDVARDGSPSQAAKRSRTKATAKA